MNQHMYVRYFRPFCFVSYQLIIARAHQTRVPYNLYRTQTISAYLQDGRLTKLVAGKRRLPDTVKRATHTQNTLVIKCNGAHYGFSHSLDIH